jgi:hypothetical protein
MFGLSTERQVLKKMHRMHWNGFDEILANSAVLQHSGRLLGF